MIDDDWPCSRTPITGKSTPAEIRAALLPEFRAAFDEAYAAAPAEAAGQEALNRILIPWHHKALMYQDPVALRRLARRESEIMTGEPCPEDEPLAVTRQRVGL